MCVGHPDVGGRPDVPAGGPVPSHEPFVHTLSQVAIGLVMLNKWFECIESKYNHVELFFCENKIHITGSFP